MPLYYFDIHNDDFTEDFEGVELADDSAAIAYAVAAARALAAATVSKGHLTLSDRIAISNARHDPVGAVSCGEAVEIRK
jgi:hypothetical protein